MLPWKEVDSSWEIWSSLKKWSQKSMQYKAIAYSRGKWTRQGMPDTMKQWIIWARPQNPYEVAELIQVSGLQRNRKSHEGQPSQCKVKLTMLEQHFQVNNPGLRRNSEFTRVRGEPRKVNITQGFIRNQLPASSVEARPHGSTLSRKNSSQRSWDWQRNLSVPVSMQD